MADESGDEGIVQKIKLALDQASMEKLAKDATEASISVVTQVETALRKSGLNEATAASIVVLVQRTREQFEKGMVGIHTKLLNNIIDIPEAEQKAGELADKINKKLVEGLKRAGASAKPFVQARIIETALIRPADIRTSVTPRELGSAKTALAQAEATAKIDQQIAKVRRADADALVDDDNSAEYLAVLADKGAGLAAQEAAAAAKEARTRRHLVETRLNELESVRRVRALTKAEDTEYLALAKEEEGIGNAAERMLRARQRQQKAADTFTELHMPGMFTDGPPGETRSMRAQRLGLDLAARARARTAEDARREAALAAANEQATDKIKPAYSAAPGDMVAARLQEERAAKQRAEDRRRDDALAARKAEAAAVIARQGQQRESQARQDERDRNERRTKEEAAEQEKNRMEAEDLRRSLGKDPVPIVKKPRITPDQGAYEKSWAQTYSRYYDKMPEGATRESRAVLEKPIQLGPDAPSGIYPQPRADIGTTARKIKSMIPIAWREAYVAATDIVRKEMAGQTSIVKDGADRIRADLKADLLIKDGDVEKAKNKLKGLFALYKVPAPREPNSTERKRINEASTDNRDRTRRINAFVAENQLAGASQTRLGKLVSMFGVDTRAVSPGIQELTNKLQGFGVSNSRIAQLLPKTGGALKNVSGAALGLVKSFGLLYTAHRVITFFKDAVQASNENEVSFTRLSTTLGDFGMRMSQASKTFMPMFDSQAKLGITYQQSAETLARLVQVTGDYQKSIRALPIIQDIVASGYMTMEQATRATGRALIGDLGNFSRYGIVLDKTKDILDQLTIRFGGELLAKSKTFSGQMKVLGVEFQNFKIVLGDTLKQSDEGVGMLGGLIDMFAMMKKWVVENAVAIKLLGAIVIATFAAIGIAIFAVIVTLATILKTIGSVGVVLRQTFVSLPQMFVEIWADSMLLILKSMRALGTAADTIFNAIAKRLGQSIRSHIGDAFDDTIGKIETARTKARETIKHNSAEGTEMLSDIWANTYQKQGVPDMPVGPGIHIRKEHNPRRQAIQQARLNLLSDNTKRSKMGADSLTEIESVVNDRILEAQKEGNKEEEKLLNTELEMIDKARKAREKKNDQSVKEQTAFNKEIARLAEVAKNRTDEKAALEAVRKLTAEHAKLIAARSRLKVGSEAWLVVEANIGKVEDAIRGRIELQDQLYEKRLKRLHNMVQLGVDEDAAMADLTQMYETAKKAAEEAEKAAKDGTKTQKEHNEAVDEAIRQRLQMSEIESAMASRANRRNEQADQAEKDMADPEKREAAERRLKALQARGERDMASGATQHIRDEGKALAARTKAILEGNQAEMKDLSKQISAGEELIKHGQTRAEGLEVLKKAEEDILELLKKQNLTLAERNDLEGKLAKLKLDLLKNDEPELDMLKSLKETFEEKGPEMIKTFATSMTDVMDTAFTGIFRDSRNLGQALRSIPRGFAKAMLDEIAKMAKGKAMENLAWAIEDTARGISALANPLTAMLAPFWFDSAAQHTAAAAAWGLLGGAAGAAGQSASNAYSNSTDFASGDRGNANANNVARGPDIYLKIDGIDPSNPRHQQLVGDAQRQYTERYGGQIVYASGK